MKKIIIRILMISIIVNVLIACTNSAGQDVSFIDWVFKIGGAAPLPDEPQSSPFSVFLSTAAAIIGGPIGLAVGGLGVGVPAFLRAKKKNQGIEGLVLATQAARDALSNDQRLLFDNTARDVMNDVKSGNPRELVRKTKRKLKKAGKMILERLSDKHQLLEGAKKTLKDLL